MAFRFTEHRTSRSSQVKPAQETRIYTARGSSDASFVRVYALGATPAFLSHERGTIYRQDVQAEPIGHQMFRVTVPYGERKKEAGKYSIDFDTTGGTVHITNSKETISRYTAPGAKAAPDMGGAIGVRGDQVDGTQVVIPALKMTVNFTHPAGIITLSQMKNLARWTGRYNSATFMTFAPGEVLFLGATGKEGIEIETTISYQFAMSENTAGQTIGTIVGVAKKGWEKAWISYEDRADGGVPHKKPRWVYVERVYEGLDLATALGFGA